LLSKLPVIGLQLSAGATKLREEILCGRLIADG